MLPGSKKRKTFTLSNGSLNVNEELELGTTFFNVPDSFRNLLNRDRIV